MEKHELSNFPLYWFASDGTPTRKEPSRRGPSAGSYACPEYADKKGRAHYKLKTASGIQTTVYKHSLAEAVRSQPLGEFLYPVPGFRSYSIDSCGTPYHISTCGIVRQLNADIGARRERFVLYDCWGRRRALSRYALLRFVGRDSGFKKQHNF
jgi:hypothetical protein